MGLASRLVQKPSISALPPDEQSTIGETDHAQGAWSRIRYAAHGANVPTGVQILRHTFCSHLAMQGAATRRIQEPTSTAG